MAEREQWLSLAEPFDDGTIASIYGRDWLDGGSYALIWETPRANAVEMYAFEEAADEAADLVEMDFYGWDD